MKKFDIFIYVLGEKSHKYETSAARRTRRDNVTIGLGVLARSYIPICHLGAAHTALIRTCVNLSSNPQNT